MKQRKAEVTDTLSNSGNVLTAVSKCCSITASKISSELNLRVNTIST